MGLRGAQLIGLLLVWMALGFAFDAATSHHQYELAQEIGQQAAEPTTLTILVRYIIAGGLGLAGAILVVRPPGDGPAPGVALGSERVREHGPRRCWKCRKKWPSGEPRCPHCGAERLR